MKTRWTTILLICTGCTMHSIPDSVEAPVDVPGSFSGGVTPEIEINPTWWTDFGDAELNRIIEKVHLENLDLKQAQSRLTQAKAMARQAGSVTATVRPLQRINWVHPESPLGACS